MKKTITSICIISSVLLVSSCTNEKPGSSFKSAIKIEDPLQGNIRSTLSDVGGEYYRFTIQENTNMSFEYAGPSNYCYSLSRYSEPEVLLKEVVSEGFSMELFPSTYYIHVYVKEENHLSNDEYKITHTGTKVEDEKGVHVPKGSREAYKLAVWENNSIPKGYKRYSEEGSGHVDNVQYLNKNEVDPMYYENNNENGKLKDEAYLDSILYIWDVDMMLSLRDEMEPINEKIRALGKLNKEDIKEIEKIIEEYKKESEASAFIKNLVIDLYEGLVVFSKTSLSDAGSYRVELADLSFFIYFCHSQDVLSEFFVEIPYYYQLSGKKVIEVSTINCRNEAPMLRAWDTLQKEDQEGLNVLDLIQEEVNKGKVTVFKNEEEYESHKRGVVIDNKPIHSVHIDLDMGSCTQYNDKYHKGYCKWCDDDEYFLIEHVFICMNQKYVCEYCGYEKANNLQTSTIVASTMPFANSFSNEVIEEDIVDSDGNTIKTKRLRTGMLEGYLTMSALSDEAETAYIEYHFDKPITSFSFYTGLWGTDEGFSTNTYFGIESYNLNNGSWSLVIENNVSNISTNKNELNSFFKNNLNKASSAIRFIIKTEKNPDSELNRGRVVLGDIQFTYLV